jgi:xanthine dehydrogenase iron-sulfur cluster and FAD-binding subunit A
MLQSHASPTPEQVRLGLGGNLCRCGTYAGIKEAVVEAGKAFANGRSASSNGRNTSSNGRNTGVGGNS